MDTFYALFKSDPLLVLGFLVSLLVAAFYFAMGAKVRVRQKARQQNAEIALDVARMQSVVRLSDYQKRRA